MYYSSSALLLVSAHRQEISLTSWQLTLPDDHTEPSALGDWREHGLEAYSGSLRYTTHFSLPTEPAGQITLSLGRVCDLARVWVNGALLPVRCWAPFDFDLTQTAQPGDNLLQVEVTNTLANALTADPAPSGLFGPVRIILAQDEM